MILRVKEEECKKTYYEKWNIYNVKSNWKFMWYVCTGTWYVVGFLLLFNPKCLQFYPILKMCKKSEYGF